MSAMGGLSAFDRATEVRPVDVVGEGRYAVTLDDAWCIGSGRPNGGYLLAVLGRAALAAGAAAGATQDHVIAAAVQYATPPTTGPATVVTEVFRVGRTASQVRASLVQDGRTSVDASFTLGHLADGAGTWWGATEPVALPDEADCIALPPPPGTEGVPATLRGSITVRFDPAPLGGLDGEPDGSGELRAWFRFPDGRDVDPLALLLVVDALPPATFAIVNTGWVPTLALSAYIRAVPAPGPLRIRFRVQVIEDGLVDEVCEVWDSRDRLVAQSTQLGAIRIPATSAG